MVTFWLEVAEVKDITLCCVMTEQPCIQVRPREMCEESG